MIDNIIEELENQTIEQFENTNSQQSENETLKEVENSNNENSENNDSFKDINEFSNILINKFPIENNSERNYFYFQIKEIDSVKINNCYIYCYNSSLEKNKFYYRLVIDLDKNINSKIKVYSNKYKISQLLNKQLGTFEKEKLDYKSFMNNITKELIETFNNLKFDKYHIKLSSISDIEKDINEIKLEKKLFSKNCKFGINECSVCYDECSTTTYCDHPICIQCVQKLNNDECPICRKKLTTFSTNYEDYDSNGEEFF